MNFRTKDIMFDPSPLVTSVVSILMRKKRGFFLFGFFHYKLSLLNLILSLLIQIPFFYIVTYL